MRLSDRVETFCYWIFTKGGRYAVFTCFDLRGGGVQKLEAAGFVLRWDSAPTEQKAVDYVRRQRYAHNEIHRRHIPALEMDREETELEL